MNTFGWKIFKKYELGLEVWYVARHGATVATFLSKQAAEALVLRAMGLLR